MAEQGKSNFIWWAIGGVALVGLGTSLYFYFRKPKGEGDKNKQNDNKPVVDTTPTPVITNTNTTTTTTTTPAPAEAGTTYFNTKEQGNAFRAYVREIDPAYAKEIDLSASGPKDNATIRKAYAKYSEKFQKANKAMISLMLQLNSAYKKSEEDGLLFKTNSTPNGNLVLDPNGRIYIYVDNNGKVSKWLAGGYYVSPSDNSLHVSIGGHVYAIPNGSILGLDKTYAWQIWRDNKIWDDANQKWLAFNLTEEQARKGFGDEGSAAQDSIL